MRAYSIRCRAQKSWNISKKWSWNISKYLKNSMKFLNISKWNILSLSHQFTKLHVFCLSCIPNTNTWVFCGPGLHSWSAEYPLASAQVRRSTDYPWPYTLMTIMTNTTPTLETLFITGNFILTVRKRVVYQYYPYLPDATMSHCPWCPYRAESFNKKLI